MAKICYRPRKFQEKSLVLIAQANRILEEYVEQGYDLTLRQLFYQFVARGLLPNTDKSYGQLGGVVCLGRLAGLIDWEHITDRTRYLRSLAHWDSPEEILESAINSFRIDMWEEQETHIEVWIEKDALVGVIEQACQELDVSFFSCRGYVSASEVWRASQRYKQYEQEVVLLHLGDHDPSGLDMTRDIQDRLLMFGCRDTEVLRIALNMDQVEQLDVPPNPTKQLDSRTEAYEQEYGDECWELDALEPAVIDELVRTEVLNYVDEGAWDETSREITEGKLALQKAARALEEGDD